MRQLLRAWARQVRGRRTRAQARSEHTFGEDLLPRQSQPSKPLNQRLTSRLSLAAEQADALTGTWSYTQGDALLIETTQTRDLGAWFTLNCALSLPERCTGFAHIGLIARLAAAQDITVHAYLRAHSATGVTDACLARDIAIGPTARDISAVLATAHNPDLPETTQTCELVLFLPSDRAITVSCETLKVFAL